MASGRVVVVADPYTVYALKMLGVEGYPVSTPEDAEKVLREVAERRDVAILLVAADFYDKLTDMVEYIEKNNPTMVVSRLPTIRNPGRPLDVQRELLRALGMG